MTTVEIPTEAARRLQAEADRRGITVDVLLVELAAELPEAAPAKRRRRKLAFAGVVASGGSEPARDADRWLADGFGD